MAFFNAILGFLEGFLILFFFIFTKLFLNFFKTLSPILHHGHHFNKIMQRKERMRMERELFMVDRIERLEDEKAALTADIREVYSEAKGVGFDIRALRQIVKLRKMDQAERREQEELVDLYKRVLGL